ncbi:MAG: S8 family serine peptidase [Pseudomonadota bacterium]
MRRIALLVMACVAAPLFAQVIGPASPASSSSGVPRNPRPTLDPVDGTVDGSLQRESGSAMEQRATTLLRTFHEELETDPRGAPVVRAAILTLSPADVALANAQAAGFVIQRDDKLDSLGERLVTLQVPRGTKTRTALGQLRRLDPQGSYDFAHLYFESAAAPPRVFAQGSVEAPVRRSEEQPEVKIGLIDTGIRLNHPALIALRIVNHGCDGKSVSGSHGTAVASLLAGEAPGFKGAAPGATLFAANVFCSNDAPGGRVDDVARALDWLVGQNARVLNLSLVGPPNVVFETLIKRVLARSIIVVAGAGDDGSRAEPLYPAAYSGVVAVTAVDGRGSILKEAVRGPHITFAAPGADMPAAQIWSGYEDVRGTSFAAPLVAGLLANRLALAGPDASPSAQIEALALEAEHPERKSRDAKFGRGLVARAVREANSAALLTK